VRKCTVPCACAQCQVRSASAKSGVRSAKSGVRSAQCAVRGPMARATGAGTQSRINPSISAISAARDATVRTWFHAVQRDR
jgi:hypothetical protein